MFPEHLVVRSPGGLFGPVAEAELGIEGITSSRNPVLSALLQEVQLPDSDRVICENRGTGIPAMLEQLRRSGSASVKFSNAINHFTVTFTRTERSTLLYEGAAFADETRPILPLTGRPAEIMALFTGDTELTASDITCQPQPCLPTAQQPGRRSSNFLASQPLCAMMQPPCTAVEEQPP